MAQKRAVKKSGKKSKPRSSNPLARTGKAKPTKTAVGAKKKSARKAVVKTAGGGAKKKAVPRAAAKATRKSAAPPRRATQAAGSKKAPSRALKQVAAKAAGPLPRKMTAQEKRAALSSPKPLPETGVREVQTTSPAVPVGVGAAPDANPANAGDQGAIESGGSGAA